MFIFDFVFKFAEMVKKEHESAMALQRRCRINGVGDIAKPVTDITVLAVSETEPV